MCWAIWISRNDVLDKDVVPSYLEVLLRGHIGFDFGRNFIRRRIIHHSRQVVDCLRLR
jgi:hypothetical protein